MENDDLIYIGLELVIAGLAVAGNVLVCWAVCLNSNLQSITNFFVVSLAVADIAVGLLAIPFAIAISTGFCAEFHGCLFIACFVLVLTQSSIFSLLAIAVDRYIAIKNPLRYNSVVTTQRAHGIIALCWILSTVIGLTPMLGWNTGGNSTNVTNSTQCPQGLTACLFEGVVTLDYMIYFNFFGCVLLPLVVMLVIYVNIFMVARHQLRLIGLKISHTRSPGEVTSSSRSTLQKEVHAAKSLAIIVGLFAFCWLPLHIINCFNYLCQGCKRPHIWVMNIAIILSHANSVVNPFIYAYRIREFRQTFHKILYQNILGQRDGHGFGGGSGDSRGAGSIHRIPSHTSREGSSCGTVVNSYVLDPSSECSPPKATQEASSHWTAKLETISSSYIPNGHQIQVGSFPKKQQLSIMGEDTVTYLGRTTDVFEVKDRGSGITFVNVHAFSTKQMGSAHSTELTEIS